MKIIGKFEDLKMTNKLASCRIYKEDLVKLENKMRRQIQQHEKVVETEDDENTISKVKFGIESSGSYEGIAWKRKENNIEEFLSSEVMGDKLDYVELIWNYNHGVKSIDKQTHFTNYNETLSRNITLIFSNDKCKVRISGENSEWINDTYSILRNYIEKRKINNDSKYKYAMWSIVLLGWITTFLLIFLSALFIWPQDSLESNLIGSILLSIMFGLGGSFFLIDVLNIDKRFRRKYPYTEIIIKTKGERKSNVMDYSIQIVLGIISGVIVSVIFWIL